MVTYSAIHVVLRANGWFGITSTDKLEQWSVGLKIFPSGSNLTENAKTTFLENVSSAFSSFHTHADVSAPAQCFLHELTCAYVGTDGLYVGGDSQDTTVRPYPTPFAGFNSDGASWDQARVYTLRTTLSRGRGHVGRFYYPTSRRVDADGRWTTTEQTNAINRAKTLLDSVNTQAASAFGSGSFIVVASPLGAPFRQVIRVEVGRAPDTQRRRTKSLNEDPKGADLAVALAARAALADRSYEA